MSDTNGQPTWTIGRRESEWSGHRIAWRPVGRDLNAWTSRMHEFEEGLRALDHGQGLDDELLDWLYDTLNAHMLSLGGAPWSDVRDELTPIEAYGVLGTIYLGVRPTEVERGESGAPSQ